MSGSGDILWQKARRGAVSLPPKHAYCAYCGLRGTEGGELIEDACGDWAHQECADIPQPEAPKVDGDEPKKRGIYDTWPR